MNTIRAFGMELVDLKPKISMSYKYIENKKLDENTALLLGFIQCSGYFGNNGIEDEPHTVKVILKGKEVEYLYPLLSREFGDSSLIDMYKVKSNTQVFRYSKTNYKATEWLRILFKDKIEKRVPEIIFNSPLSVIKNYIKGVFQADSANHINKPCYGVNIRSVSRNFLNDLRDLLTYVGIYSTIKDISKRYTVESMYELHLNTYFSNIFKRDIGYLDKSNIEYNYVGGNVVNAVPIKIQLLESIWKVPKPKEQSVRRAIKSGVCSIDTLTVVRDTGVELPEIYNRICDRELYPISMEESYKEE